MNSIVVLGGGFAGVSVTLKLLEKINLAQNEIILIDRNSFHTFNASLYEVATMESPQKNIIVPFDELFGKKVKIISGTISVIDRERKKVILADKTQIDWDYLVITLGSEISYFNIPGLKDFSLPLKSLSDAIRIQSRISALIKSKQKEIKVIIGGGGFSGVELAGELLNLCDRLQKEHHLANAPLEISIIEKAPSLLCELDPRVSAIAYQRLKQNGVKIYLNTKIEKVEKSLTKVEDGNIYPFDLLIWTGGIKANQILQASNFKVNNKGQVPVDQTLKVAGEENIYAGGDLAEYKDIKTSNFAPQIAPVACSEGSIIGENIYRQINNMALKKYQFKHTGYVIPIKGQYAIADLYFCMLTGFLGWLLQQLIILKYFLQILPPFKAFYKWNKFERYLKQN